MSGKAVTAREMAKRLQLLALCRKVAAKMEGKSNKSQGVKGKRA